MSKSALTVALFFAAALAVSPSFPAVAQNRTAQDRTVTLLQQLTDASGPPGFEEPIRKVLVDLIKPLASSITYDGLGSIIAAQGAQGPRIMVDAHMDELGGMIRRVTPRGLLTMQMLGGWLDQALVDQRWTILGSKGPVRAVTGIRDVHVVPADERTRVYPRDSLFLDVGATSEADVAEMGIAPGDPVVPDAPFTILNGTNNYLAKGWDDRVGCGVIVEAMRRLATQPHSNQILWTITTQEEVGLRGAESAAAVVKPEIAIAIEGGITGDVFGGRPEETQARLGAGPGIFLYDSSAIPNRKLTALVKQTASERQIPLQADLVQGYGDDSAAIQRSNGGVPSVNLVVPIRYTHSHNGIMNRRDFDQMVELLVAVLQKLDASGVARVRDFTP
ncbi:MAG TPA: M42 family metallopeptidase [Vicinamibacterales bacterium]|nr:M42 family metallopeptidase [Vicinamibacterales bacterium]